MVSVVDVTGQVREGQLPWAVGSGAEGGPGRCLRGPGQVRVTTIRTGASVQLRRPGEGCVEESVTAVQLAGVQVGGLR